MKPVSQRARREADLFYQELVYGPRRQGAARETQWTETSPSPYTTGAVTARPGWTFVAYLGPRVARLGFNVTRPTPAGRIGNIGWITNNPGSIDLSPPFKIVAGRRVAAGAGERLAVRHGAFEKNPADIREYRRFAVFPDRQTGERAIFPLLVLLARANGNPRVGEVLRIYYGISDPTARQKYEDDIRTRLARSYASRLSMTDPGLAPAERDQRATQLANGLLQRKFLDLERFVTFDSEYLTSAVLDVESTRDMARVGLLYTCEGFGNRDQVRRIYAADAGKLREIEALVGSPAVASQLDGVMGCGAPVQA